jgi:mono/diheme cytochrome c family protein
LKFSGYILALLVSLAPLRAADPAKASFEKDIRPLLEENCFACHGNGKAKGEVSLEGFKTAADVHHGYKLWETVRRKVAAGEMPPKKRNQRPDKTEQLLIAGWIRHSLDEFYANAPPDPGRVTVRRLNRAEYNNVIRDLMRVDFKPAKEFPADDSGHGFDNIGDVLSMSPLLLEKYLAAAEKIAEEAVAVPPRGKELDPKQLTEFQKVYFKYPIPRKLRRRSAEGFVRPFLRRAYRREVTQAEIGRVMLLAKQTVDDGGSFEEGVRLAVMAVLVSPHFIFRWELDGAPDNPLAIRSLNEYELAARLSFFIWSSLPDDRLMQLTNRGQLRKNLSTELTRMLKDERAIALVENFAGQWLELRNLDVYQPDRKLFPSFTPALRDDMRRETELLFTHVMRGNRSVLEILSADYSFINERLAAHYGIKSVEGNQFRSVSLRGTARGGILGHASILTITSDPNRTSPVKRGKYVLENILGTPPPPPPPDVPEFKVSGANQGTLREQLVKHRVNAICASCHEKMDPIGFAFENFDAIGRYRTKDNGRPIDATGKLESGESFKNASDLRRILATKKRDQFARCLTEKMLTYALGRGLEYYDKRTVDHVVGRLQKNGFRFNELIHGIVTSLPFDMKRGEAGK